MAQKTQMSFRHQLKVMRFLIFLLLGLLLLAAGILFVFSMNEEVVGRGVVIGFRTYELKSSVQSRITKIHFVEGDAVKAGDVLLELDCRDLDERIEYLRNYLREVAAEIEVKEWKLKLLKLDPLPQEYRHTRIALQESEARVNTSEAEMKTYTRLRERGVISEVEFHRRELELVRSRAEYEKLSDDYKKLESGLADQIIRHSESELELLRVRQDGRARELKMMEERMADYRFTAPEDGTISYIPTKLGTYVEPGQLMVNLASSGGKKFLAYVDEAEVYKVMENQMVRVASSQYNTLEYGYFSGKVLYLGELPEERAGRTFYPVFILLTDEPYPLRIGSTGEAKITVGRSRIISNLTGFNKL